MTTTTTILHLSDLHIHRQRWRPENRRLARIVAWIVEHCREAAPPPVVVITGDLVDDGTREQYERLLELLAPLKAAGLPILACPGNHDSGPMGNSYYVSARVDFQRHVLGEVMGIAGTETASDRMAELFPLVHTIGDARFIGLDSVAGMIGESFHFAQGALGLAQIRKLRAILATPHAGPTIVYLHHHPFNRLFTECLRDAEALMGAMKDKVDVVLFGHRHRSALWSPKDGIDVVIAAGKTTEPEGDDKFELREVALRGRAPEVSRYHIDL
ncbi:MAG: metallophosphoesterase [Myxococcales bacterium]|nr:metallophosphoesterase [Myxococcales bacterium]